MGKFYRFTILVFLTVSLASCQEQPEKISKRNIILDVDMSVDDMMSMLYFLSCPDIDIKAITIESGVSTVDSGAEIVLRLLQLTGHPEIPVAKGSGIPLEGNLAFPEEWRPPVNKPFGLELPAHHLKFSDIDAVTLITNLAGQYKNNIAFMALGPMTNLARALQRDPNLAANITQVYVSDGAVEVEGGIYQEWPQVNNHVSGWNLWVDAQAANLVFSSGLPIILVPLDLTALHGRDPLVLTPDFAARYHQVARDTLGRCMSVLMENWLASYVYNPQGGPVAKGVPIWDLVACMIFHHPEIGTAWQERQVRIKEGKPETAGQIITVEDGVPNVKICFKGNQALLDSLLLVSAGR
jgi:inosine-uridine nucleoside N-ribohydrolase